MRAPAVLIALATAGCAIDGDFTKLDTPEPEPPYRKIVVENMHKILPRFPEPVAPKGKRRGPAIKPAERDAKPADAPPNVALGIIDVPTTLDSYQISGVRRVHHLSGWAWLTCLKIADQPSPIAIFIRDDKIVDLRRSVLIDDCDNQSYEVLKAPKPPPRRARRK